MLLRDAQPVKQSKQMIKRLDKLLNFRNVVWNEETEKFPFHKEHLNGLFDFECVSLA